MNTHKTVPHTPTPWHDSDLNTESEALFFKDGIAIGSCSRRETAMSANANAAYIVLCVNSHERLISVVRQMVELWDNDGDHGFPLYDEAKAALAASQPQPDHE